MSLCLCNVAIPHPRDVAGMARRALIISQQKRKRVEEIFGWAKTVELRRGGAHGTWRRHGVAPVQVRFRIRTRLVS